MEAAISRERPTSYERKCGAPRSCTIAITTACLCAVVGGIVLGLEQKLSQDRFIFLWVWGGGVWIVLFSIWMWALNRLRDEVFRNYSGMRISGIGLLAFVIAVLLGTRYGAEMGPMLFGACVPSLLTLSPMVAQWILDIVIGICGVFIAVVNFLGNRMGPASPTPSERRGPEARPSAQAQLVNE
ncbi:hypothetical protein N431DRAFT_429504 [Stipitochalara longipes BDJ]|nr:hypothetical protein N431DRAFT_429504 [Stipitochalara longipes BDJ]